MVKTDGGQELLEKELKVLGIKFERLNEVVQKLNFKHIDDLMATLGRGDLKLGQILARLTPVGVVAAPIKLLEKPNSRTE